MNNKSIKLLVLGVILLAAFLIGGSYFYSKVAKKPVSSQTTSSEKDTANEIGIKAARQLSTNYPQLIKRASIQQQIEGTLKASTPNSWTVEAGGKSLTLLNQDTNKVRLTKLPKTATASSAQATLPTEIKPEELKIGDLVSINQIIDWKTGKVTILGITVLPQK